MPIRIECPLDRTPQFDRERIVRAARLYHSNGDAARACGIHTNSFRRLCRRYEVETPNERRDRQRVHARRKEQAA